MNAHLMPGGVRLFLLVKAARSSPAGRFVRRHRAPLLATCVTTPGAALLSAKIEALGFVPAGVPGALWPAVSAAIAGALTASPRLHSAAVGVVRVVKSAATTVFAATGGAVIAAVLFWDKLGPIPAWTLDEAVAQLRAGMPAILYFLIMAWFMAFTMRAAYCGFRFGPVRNAALFDRKMAARHEAAHALVATVLGLSVKGAWVPYRPDERGVGGGVALAPSPAAPAGEALYGLLARKVAVNVAGVVGARGTRSVDAILHELQGQNDWVQARELSWIGASLRPDRVLWQDVLEAVAPALHTAPWKSAIVTASKAILHAAGDPVQPEVFAAIARRFGLALPAVETLAAALPNPPTQEITA